MLEIYEDHASNYAGNLKVSTSSLTTIIVIIITQVETLACVSAIHNRDLESCLTFIDRKIKYYSTTEVPWYFRLMTIHLGEMNELKQSDPATWERLKTDFVVSESILVFCSLFDGLEQEIKELKRYGHLPGITQDENAMV